MQFSYNLNDISQIQIFHTMESYAIYNDIQGFGVSAQKLAIFSMCGDRFDDSFVFVMSWVETFAGIGATVGGPLGALLYSSGHEITTHHDGLLFEFVIWSMVPSLLIPVVLAMRSASLAEEQGQQAPSTSGDTARTSDMNLPETERMLKTQRSHISKQSSRSDLSSGVPLNTPLVAGQCSGRAMILARQNSRRTPVNDWLIEFLKERRCRRTDM